MIKKTQKVIMGTIILFVCIMLFCIGIFVFLQDNLILQIFNSTKEGLPGMEKYKVFNMKIIYLIISVTLLVVTVIVSKIMANIITLPMYSLVSTAESIIRGDEVEIKPLKENGKSDQFDELVHMFAGMNSDLKDNLNRITRSKSEVETILKHLTDGVISFDNYGKISHINPAAVKAIGINAKSNFARFAQKVNINPDMEKIIYMETLTSQGLQYKDEDASRIYNIVFDPLKTDEDKPYGLIVFIQEITEHVRLDEMRKQFVADVSHELKTPITAIMGYAQTIVGSDVDPEKTNYFVEKINNEAYRMSEIVSDLLILSKYDKSNKEDNKTTFQIVDVVKEWVENYKMKAEEKDIDIRSFVTADIPEIYADKSGVVRVITNIISNAIKYTQERGHIEVYIGFIYTYVYVKVKDNGIGIKKEDLSRLFERFYRVDSSRVRKSGGSGLGLSIAKEIIESNNGTIDIKSEYGKGTEVIMRFPTSYKKNI